MVKKLLMMCGILFTAYVAKAQPANIYNPKADTETEIKQAVVEANAQNKHVFLQIGGNWCSWCRKFHNLVNENKELRDFADKNFIVVKVNYSKENKNADVLKKLDFPQRFGFPVFVILDGTGKRIHTQNSAYLEENEGYDEKKVLEFFKQWSPAALNPASYEK